MRMLDRASAVLACLVGWSRLRVGVAPAVHMCEGMTTHEMPAPDAGSTRYHRWLRLGLGVFLAIALFFLWEGHRAHLLGALPWLLLLACPLMRRGGVTNESIKRRSG